MDEQPQSGLVSVMMIPDLRRRLVRLSQDDLLVLVLRRTCRYLHAHLPYDPLGCPATLLDVMMGCRGDGRGYSQRMLNMIARPGLAQVALSEGDVEWAYAMCGYMSTLSDILERKTLLPEETLWRFLETINKHANNDPTALRRLMDMIEDGKWPLPSLWRGSSRFARIIGGYWRHELLVASGAYTSEQAIDIVCSRSRTGMLSISSWLPCRVAGCTVQQPCAECARLLPLGTDHSWRADCTCEACRRQTQWHLRHEPRSFWPGAAVLMRAKLVHMMNTPELDAVPPERLESRLRVERLLPQCRCVDWTVPEAEAETEWTSHDEQHCKETACKDCGYLACPTDDPEHYAAKGCPSCQAAPPDE